MSYAESYEPYYSTVAVSPEGLTLGIEDERENERVFGQTFSIVSAFDEHVVVTQPAPGDPPEAPGQPSIQLADNPWSIELEWASHHSAHAYDVAMRVASDDGDDDPWTWVGLFWGDLPVFRVLFWGLPQEEKLEWLIRAFNYDGVADSPILPIEMIAPAPTDLTAQVLNSTSVSMSWTDESANESGFRILGLRFEHGLPLEWKTLAALDADVTEAELTDLYPGAEYHLRVAAWTPNNVAESKTEEIDLPTPKPPEGPSDLSGSVENWKSATLAWSDAEVEAGYRVEGRLGEGEWQVLRELERNVTSILLEDLETGGAYEFRLQVFNESGDDYSNTVQVDLSTSPLSAPPSNLAGEVLSQTSAKFTWTDNSDDETRFFVIGRPESLDISWGVLAIVGPNATEATATSLEARSSLQRLRVSGERPRLLGFRDDPARPERGAGAAGPAGPACGSLGSDRGCPAPKLRQPLLDRQLEQRGRLPGPGTAIRRLLANARRASGQRHERDA